MKKIFLTLILIAFFPSSSFSAGFTFPNFDLKHPDKLCKDQWTKRGVLNERMYNYCMNKAEKGYQKALYIYNEFKTEKWIDDVAKHSYDQWTKRGNIDYNMFAYEMNTQKEGFLDLEYEIQQGNFTESEVKKCTNKWYPQFRMIVYCLKN